MDCGHHNKKSQTSGDFGIDCSFLAQIVVFGLKVALDKGINV
jgi:hypothetical protein